MGASILLVVIAIAASTFGGTGALLVTVTGPGTSEATGIEVLVDGEKHCVASPCRIAAIKPGTHLVNVRGQGFEPTAALAVTVSARAESVLNVSLSRATKPLPAEVARTAPSLPPVADRAPPNLSKTAAAQTQPPSQTGAPAARAREAPKALSSALARHRSEPVPAAPGSAPSSEKSAFGTLRIVSLPVASILVDGKPIGHTPQVVKVTPGSHRVAIFIGEERRVQTVTVAPGASQVVSVRF